MYVSNINLCVYVCLRTNTHRLLLVGQRGEQKGMLRDTASLREGSKDVSGDAADRE